MTTLRLYLLRHAKSSPAEPGMADFDRPLAERGRDAADAMGRLMAREGFRPTLVLCSTARRTRETLAGLLPHLGEEMTIDLSRRIYSAGTDGLVDLLGTADHAPGVLVIGHNPPIEDLARTRARSGDPNLLAQMAAKFPPGALAVIDFEAENWVQAIAAGGRLAAFHVPE